LLSTRIPGEPGAINKMAIIYCARGAIQCARAMAGVSRPRNPALQGGMGTRQISDSRTAMIPGATHPMFEQAPQKFCEIVLEFLAGP
jgi:hypothetical protein